jgi:Flp pilus assembly protein TadG
VRRGQQGAAVLELVLLVPVFLLMVYVVVGLGRLGQAREDIDAAARDAARAGSLARSPEEAHAAAQAAATEALDTHDVICADLGVDIDTAQFRPAGWVRVELSCRVALADLVGMWTPGSKTVQARAQAVVDAFRGAT